MGGFSVERSGVAWIDRWTRGRSAIRRSGSRIGALDARASLVAGGALVACVLMTSRASAFPTSRLTYVRNKGTDRCPTEEIVRSEGAPRLGYDPFFVWAERTIVAQIWREATGYRASVQLLDAQGVVRGSRALRSASEDCSELVKAAALAISISIDPEAATRAPGTPPAMTAVSNTESAGDPSAASNTTPPRNSNVPPRRSALAATPDDGLTSDAETSPNRAADAATPPPPSAPDTSRERAEDRGSPAARIAPMLGASLWSAVNLAPSLSFGGTAFAGAEWRSLGLFAEIRKSLPASSDDVTADLLVFAILPCVRYAFVFGCADLDVGQLRFEGAQSKTARYLAAGGRLGAQMVVYPVVLRAHLDVLSPLDRTVVLVNGSEVWRLPAMSVALGLGASLPF